MLEGCGRIIEHWSHDPKFFPPLHESERASGGVRAQRYVARMRNRLCPLGVLPHFTSEPITVNDWTHVLNVLIIRSIVANLTIQRRWFCRSSTVSQLIQNISKFKSVIVSNDNKR